MMVIVAIIALSAVVLTMIFAVLVGLPSMPADVVNSFNLILTYIGQGASYVYYFVYPATVNALLRVTIAFELVIYGYRFVMWVVKKVPMFGVSD